MDGNLVISSTEIAQGKKLKGGRTQTGSFIAPLQFLPREEKDDDWAKNNADYWEWQGLRQIFITAPRALKNINLSKGVIDKADYMPTTNPQNQDVLEILMQPDEDLRYDSLRFFPITPIFVNSIVAEFAQRRSEFMFQGTDERSNDELLQMKSDEVLQVLLSEAEAKVNAQLADMGISIDSPEGQQAYQEQMQQAKSLPEIQTWFKSSYRSNIEQWADHQTQVDIDRFNMEEQEIRNFRYSVELDKECWHFRMLEDDYVVESWNPVLTAIFKSPDKHYYSEGYAAINVSLLTVPDVIDNFGWLMNEDQQKSMETIYPTTNTRYALTGYDKDALYDTSKTIQENDRYSMDMKRSIAGVDIMDGGIVNKVLNQVNTTQDPANYMARVTTGYWKSQRKVGKLTAILENGEQVIDIVDESYVITNKPVYNKTFISVENPDTLIFGEHIDWTWIPQVYGFIKIGPNIPTWNNMSSVNPAGVTGFNPIYLGVNQNKIGPVRYQFNQDSTLYGARLPIEGATFSDYNGRIVPPVQLMEPYQINFNVVNNQISDILMDELGTVVAFDPNLLPTESLGDDWGKHNYSKAYATMRNYQMLPLDKRLQHTQDAASSNSQLQSVDLSQTGRLKSRMELAAFFLSSAFSTVGLNPQRLGQQTGRQTATGVEENLNASYNQTEMIFVQHSDWLMPRVHGMRTDLAMHYNSSKPSVRLQYTTTHGQKVNFQINGSELKLRQINVYPKSSSYSRGVVDAVLQRIRSDNTSNFEIFDLVDVESATSIGELSNVMNGIKQRMQEQVEAQHQRQLEIEKANNEAAIKEKQLEFDAKTRWIESQNRKDIIVAEIRAAGYSGAVDLNDNAQNDYLDNLKVIQDQTEFNQAMGLDRQKETNRLQQARDQANLRREEIAAKLQMKEMDVNIARENTTASELEAKKKAIEKEKKKKKE